MSITSKYSIKKHKADILRLNFFVFFSLLVVYFILIWIILINKMFFKELKTRLCSTPPPSPSKFSPPLPELNDQNDAYNEEQMKKSAFVKVASLNPYLNLSQANLISNSNSTINTVDLASLLGSLGSLKRSQRF